MRQVVAGRNRITINVGKVQVATELATDANTGRAKKGRKAA